MKKIANVFFLFCSLFCSFFLCMHFTYALEFSTVHSGYYYEMKSLNNNDYASWMLDYYTINNQVAYCIETGVDEGEEMLEGNWGDTHLPEAIKERMLLLAYYGYNYVGHENERYRAATQALLWETILGENSKVTYSSNRYGSGNIYDVDDEKAEIEKFVEHHYDKPSFQGITVTVQIGKQIELEDTNQVLSNFDIPYIEGADVQIHDNILSITPMEEGDITLIFTKRRNYSSNYKIFYGDSVQNMLVVGNVEDVSFEVKIKAVSGRISLTKYDSETVTPQGGASLEGAVYAIYRKSDDSLMSYIRTDENGYAEVSGFYYDEYYLKEIENSEGYSLDETIYFIDFYDAPHVHIRVPEKVVKGKIHILKLDSETNLCQGPEGTTLEGAQYGVYDLSGNLVDTLRIGADCQALSKELPYGHYIVKENIASTGYLLDTTIYSIFIENGRTIEIISLEPILRNKIVFFKQIEQIQENATIYHSPEEGVLFEIYDTKNSLYRSVLTDKEGYATLELPYGIWRVHQKNTQQGYERVDDFLIYVDSNSEMEQTYTLIDKQELAYLQICKVDAETKKEIALAGTTFKIVNVDTNQYVFQRVNDKIYDTFETNATGKLSIPLRLPAGNYQILEVKSPLGYLVNKDGVFFSISHEFFETSLLENRTMTIYFENSPIKGQVIVHKKGESLRIEEDSYTFLDIPLKNVVFGIYAQDTVVSSDGQFVYYQKGELVDTIVTQKDGEARSRFLPIGHYYLKELKTLDDYILDSTSYSFSIRQVDSLTPIVYVYNTFKNQLKKGTLELSKVDASSKQALPNTEIQIFTKQEECIFTGKTDGEGKLVVQNLPVGKYYIREIKAPFGYQLYMEKIPFLIQKNGEVMQFTMENDRKLVTFEIDKKDNRGNPLEGVIFGIYNSNGQLLMEAQTDIYGRITLDLPYGKYFYQELYGLSGFIIDRNRYSFTIENENPIFREIINQKQTFKTTIHKIDQDFHPLTGVEIGIYTLDGILLSTGFTDLLGDISFLLENGSYYYQERSTLDTYLLDNQKYYFEVNGEEKEFTLVNEKEEVAIPSTFKNESHWLEIFVFIFIFVVMGWKYAKS